jgi:hypothetical protein
MTKECVVNSEGANEIIETSSVSTPKGGHSDDELQRVVASTPGSSARRSAAPIEDLQDSAARKTRRVILASPDRQRGVTWTSHQIDIEGRAERQDRFPIGRATRSRSHAPTFRTPFPVLRTSGSSTSEIPEGIRNIILRDEVDSINHFLVEMDLTLDTCPLSLFIQLYLKNGRETKVLKYCRHALAAMDLEADMTANKSGQSQDHIVHWGFDENLPKDKLHHLDQLDDALPSQPILRIQNNLKAIFHDVDEHALRSYMKMVPDYQPASSNEAESDWCAWCTTITPHLAARTIIEANYILLWKAGMNYVQSTLNTFGTKLRGAHFKYVMRLLGKSVYKAQGKDPIFIASKQLKKGRFGCADYAGLFQRVIELHNCRLDRPTKNRCIVDMYHGIEYKLPLDDRPTFCQRITQKYQTLDDYDQEFEVGYQDDLCQPIGSLPFPVTPTEIEIFEEHLVRNAVTVINIRNKKSNFWNLCSDPDHKIWGLGATPNTKHSKASASATTTSDVSSQDTKAVSTHAVEAKKWKGKKNQNDSVFCQHCKKKGHDEAKCWMLHPELKPKFYKSNKEGKQMKKESAPVKKEERGKCIAPQSAPYQFDGGKVTFTIDTDGILPLRKSEPATKTQDFQ